MNFFKNHGKWIAVYTVAWCFAKQLFLAIKLWGIESSVIQDVKLSNGILFSAVAVTGLLDGFVFGLVDTGFDTGFKKVRFIGRVLIKAVINLSLGLTLTLALVPTLVGVARLHGVTMLSEKLINTNLIILGLYTLLITFLLQLVKMTASWIQTHDLAQIISNKSSGIEEDRIFMFLDMKSSTTHAEKLGPAKYSLLIQDCFSDMAKAAEVMAAEIYQYVGDEAVFTWTTSDRNLRNSIQLYFCFRENLQQRAWYYRDKYGLVPAFKAGIHHGNVIRTQVGTTRKSIAFHGDAINTASRIQGQCNALGQDLLVSAAIMDGLPQNYQTEWEGSFQLRGKNQEVDLFSIQEPESKTEQILSNVPGFQYQVDCRKAGLPAFKVWLNFF